VSGKKRSRSLKPFLRHLALAPKSRYVLYTDVVGNAARQKWSHTRIGTFACRSNPTAHPKQAKEPIFPNALTQKSK